MNAEKLAHLRRHLAARIRSLRKSQAEAERRQETTSSLMFAAMILEAQGIARQLPRLK